MEMQATGKTLILILDQVGSWLLLLFFYLETSKLVGRWEHKTLKKPLYLFDLVFFFFFLPLHILIIDYTNFMSMPFFPFFKKLKKIAFTRGADTALRFDDALYNWTAALVRTNCLLICRIVYVSFSCGLFILFYSFILMKFVLKLRLIFLLSFICNQQSFVSYS